MRIGLRPRPPTDFEILREVYERHRQEFADGAPTRSSKVFVPVDIPGVARNLGADPDTVFGRLYYHLQEKYGEKATPGQPRKSFFTLKVGDDVNAVNFPFLEAILAGLWTERRRDYVAVVTAFLSLGIASASLLVSIFA